MILYLLRHGPAESPGLGQPDSERALTPHGLELMQRAAQALARALPAPERFLTSPYLRARQTAEAVAGAWQAAPVVEPRLASGARFSDFAAAWDEHGRPDRWGVVGHQPDLGDAVYHLAGAATAIQPGTLAVVEAHRMRPGGGRLLALYPPQTLAALAG